MAGGVAANALGKVWVLILQIASIPILTAKWGVDGYGIWLMLISVPTYIALSDFGFGAAAGVELTRRLASDDTPGALNVFHSSWAFVTTASIAISLVIATSSFFFLPYENATAFGTIPTPYVVAAVVLYALLIVQTQLLLVVFRSARKYARGTVLLDVLTFIEGAVHLAAVVAGASIPASLAVLIATRLVVLTIYYYTLRREERWFFVGLSSATRSTIRSLASPSAAAVALNIANSLALQGVIITLGATSGGVVVAMFSTARFITRIPLQLTGLITRASIPELTKSLHDNDTATSRRLIWVNVGSSLLLAAPVCALILVAGPQFASALSHGQLVPALTLFLPLTLAAALNATWTSLATPLIATNRHAAFSYVYFGASIVVAAVPLAPLPLDAATATSWASLLAELCAAAVVAVYVLPYLRRSQRPVGPA